MSSFEIISDYSKASLKEIPEPVLEMTNLKMLFLERNFLVQLPENFFYRLPNLMWLDLRNNQLQELPKSIAHHEHLEHLLLTNNDIKKLPNELGLVSNLKALQIADNPLIYPSRKIIQDGTKAIKRYLQEQYELERVKNNERQKQENEDPKELLKRQLMEKRQAMEMQEEKLIKVHEKTSNIESNDRINRSSGDKFYSAHKFINAKSAEPLLSRQNNATIEYLQNKLTDPNGLSPTLRVKKIEQPNKKPEEPLKIVHTFSKNGSRMSLKSYFNKSNIQDDLEKVPENVLKEGWLNKLRILLNDQERILQQERNLMALSAWRQKSPSTPKVFSDIDANVGRFEPPYATYSEYARIPSRSELASQLQSFLNEPEVCNSKPPQTPRINLDKVINDLVEQLKEMENCSEVKSPKSELEYAGWQIQTIVDIHKKLLKLKSTNDYF